MFFYQAIIMAAVVVSIYILSYFLKVKRRKILVASIVGLITAGGVGLYAINYYFGNHYYNQKVNPQTLEQINISASQKQDLHKIFNDYSEISNNGKTNDALGRTYHVNGNNATSTIDSDIYIFSNTKDADNYFEASQKFYENKSYIPLDSDRSKKVGEQNRYLVSFIKSQYKNYSDLIYLPSKIQYSSDVMIQDNNVIILITETANRPVTNKAAVISDILNKLKQS